MADLCAAHNIGKAFIKTTRVISASCHTQDRLADSGASRVSRGTRPPLDSAHGENETFGCCSEF